MSDARAASKRLDLVGDHAVVQVKPAISSARSLHHALASLAMDLAERDDLRGYLLLPDPELSQNFIGDELRRFKTALRPDIANRLRAVVSEQGRFVGNVEGIPQADEELLRQGLRKEEDQGTVLPKPSKQDEVFLIMLHQWVTGQSPMTLRWIEDTVGCNYRTVAAAIESLGHAVLRGSDRSVSLKHFPEPEWGRYLARAHRTRSTMHFADASDQPRSPESLLRRLRALAPKHVAVGGVPGARRYHPEMDLIGTPRLDLCVHAPGRRVDLGFVRQLDPALERTRDPHRPARLALHFLRRKNPLFDRDENGSRWADPVECLCELVQARLDAQARDFQEVLVEQGRGRHDSA